MIMHSFALKYRHHPFTICLPFFIQFIQFLGFLFTAWKDSKGLKVSAVIHHNCSWTKTVLNLSKSRYGMIWLQTHELIKCNFSLVTFSIQSYWDMLHSPVWWTASLPCVVNSRGWHSHAKNVPDFGWLPLFETQCAHYVYYANHEPKTQENSACRKVGLPHLDARNVHTEICS